jgi:hypothetical protein
MYLETIREQVSHIQWKILQVLDGAINTLKCCTLRGHYLLTWICHSLLAAFGRITSTLHIAGYGKS